jgi:serine/threonine protein kinase
MKVMKQGWLSQRGDGLIKKWTKHWFRLSGVYLTWCNKPSEDLGRLALTCASKVSAAPECQRQHAFKVVVPSGPTYYLQADTKSEYDSWIGILSEVISTGTLCPPRSRCGEPLVDADSFEVLKSLWRTEWGDVHLVRSKIDGELYALERATQTEEVRHGFLDPDVLLTLHHPFLASAHAAFETPQGLYLVSEYVPGGKLFARFTNQGERFPESQVRLYAAEMALGLGALHTAGFVYGDLNPDHLLVDEEGHLKLSGFGIVKTETVDSFHPAIEYFAPEVLQQSFHTNVADWWSFGVLVFEMIVGLPPLYHENTNRLRRMILQDPVTYPSSMSTVTRDFIGELLNRDPTKRLGAGPEGLARVMSHPFFSGLDWEDVRGKRTAPEWVPTISNPEEPEAEDDPRYEYDDAKWSCIYCPDLDSRI